MITLNKIPETENLILSTSGASIILTDGTNEIARQECENANAAEREVFEMFELMTFEGNSIRERGGSFPQVRLHDDDLHAKSHFG